MHRLSFFEKAHEWLGIKDPPAYYKNFVGNPKTGLASFMAAFYTGGSLIVFFVGLLFLFTKLTDEKLENFERFFAILILCGIISFVLNYFPTFYKDKYLKYFKKFDKKPRKWKVRWALVSLVILLLPIAIILYAIFM